MTVHLARKWRSKNFNELVGQELSVRLLKNSLYKKAFFPAYLFSGLRGSGKTSMGRIFAAAVNCEQLDEFTKAPQTVILPCGSCMSCRALFAGQHPDFIEIDAASHTGVDNMRLIIESASMLPTLARKKIYLIDEAHMLSKAAFNAALKILEEPPVHVMFILATTDPEKIIETIKSRCFQVFFDPIPLDILVSHLQRICDAETITCDSEGLSLLVQQSGGSARDALTLLERVALASDNVVTTETVSRVLGLIGKELISQLYGLIKNNNTKELLLLIKNNRHDSYTLWKELTEHIRKDLYAAQSQQDYERTLRYLKISYQTEQLLAKTSMADAIIEFMLLSMCNPEQIHESVKNVKVVKEAGKPAAQGPIAAQPWDQFIDVLKTHAEPNSEIPTQKAPARQPVQQVPAQKTATQRPVTQPAAAQSQTVSQALKIFPGTIQEV